MVDPRFASNTPGTSLWHLFAARTWVPTSNVWSGTVAGAAHAASNCEESPKWFRLRCFSNRLSRSLLWLLRRAQIHVDTSQWQAPRTPLRVFFNTVFKLVKHSQKFVQLWCSSDEVQISASHYLPRTENDGQAINAVLTTDLSGHNRAITEALASTCTDSYGL